VDHQRLSGAGYCFSAAAPPFVSTAALAALDLLRADSSTMLPKLSFNSKLLRSLLAAQLQGTRLRVASPLCEAAVPFTHLELAEPSGDAARDIKALEDIVDAIAGKGYAVAVAKHDTSFRDAAVHYEPAIKDMLGTASLGTASLENPNRQQGPSGDRAGAEFRSTPGTTRLVVK